jgi:hypothetical protein
VPQLDYWILIKFRGSLEFSAAVHARCIFIALGFKCAKVNILLLVKLPLFFKVELILIVLRVIIAIFRELANAGAL